MNLEEIYKKGTAKQLWDNGWDVTQRTHFLIDHYDAFGPDLESDVNKYAQKFSHSAWKDLPKAIQTQVAIHHAMGIYKDGGKIKPPMKYLTTDKKKLLAGISTIKQRAAKVKDEKTLAALNEHLKKMEALLNAPKLPASEKISKWKGDKAARRMARKMA